MAYQPILGPPLGHLSKLSTGTNEISLSGPGVNYVALAVRIAAGTVGKFAFPVESVSVLAGIQSDLEWSVVINATILGGGPLVYSQLDPLSVVEGAVGDGSQEVIGGITMALGRFVPKGEERGMPREILSSAFDSMIPPDTIGMLVVASMSNMGSVNARFELLEIPLDENGQPVSRGSVTGG